MITHNRKTDREIEPEVNPVSRAYELVTPEDFGRLRSKNSKHHDLVHAIRHVKNLPAGQGVKLKCPGSPREHSKKQKAAVAIARRAKVPVRTMIRDGWLFIEKIKPN